jgi:hypothetical protein
MNLLGMEVGDGISFGWKIKDQTFHRRQIKKTLQSALSFFLRKEIQGEFY